jgi:predicted Fe-S protein YdhL (DUF1289 family)
MRKRPEINLWSVARTSSKRQVLLVINQSFMTLF